MNVTISLTDARATLDALDRVLREAPNNVSALCTVGRAAHRFGMAQASQRAFDRSVELLLQAIRAGDANTALAIEELIYPAFVKALEDEDHYERCLARYREPLAELARKYRAPAARVADGARRRIGFLLHNGVVLGHTEVLFRLVESMDRAAFEPRVYVLHHSTPEFLARARALGVEVAAYDGPAQEAGGPLRHVQRLQWVRQRLARDATPTAVWVSAPLTATFMFAMRVAPVQVFWSLRYHPVRLPEIDGYITYGSWAEEERTFHGQRWTVCPVPLALDTRAVPSAAVAEVRARYPHEVLLGSLAREEKLDSRAFLESVAEILERHPQAGFLWTGQKLHPGIEAFFRERGLAERTHFIGWVDTALYAAALDVFLETFPLGCGITGYQAMAAGVPLLSYLEPNTVFGMQYWSELMGKSGSPARVTREQLDAYDVLCARDPAEYVQLASRLIDDETLRAQWKAREARYYAEEIRGIARYSTRFFDTLAAITARTLSD
jgi:glycosyltransferase involved in cell wall biosynthesis